MAKNSGKTAKKRGGARPGSGRPAKFSGGRYVTVRMPAALIDQLDDECEQRKLTRSDVVVEKLSQSYQT